MDATAGMNRLDDSRALESAVERFKTMKALGLVEGLDFHGRVLKPMAKQIAAALAPPAPMFIDEFLLSEHVEGIAALGRQISIPIALGGRPYSSWDVKQFLENGGIDILQLDLAHGGGISEVRSIAAMAEAYDDAIAPHCPLGPIALAASMQIGASTSN